jgi:hypothetical protein
MKQAVEMGSDAMILWHTDPLLGNDRETKEQPFLDSGTLATMEVLLEAVFSMLSAPTLYDSTDRVK